MKKIFAILLIVVLGIALGVGIAMLKIKAAPWNPTLDNGGPATGTTTTNGSKPVTKAAQVGYAPVAAGFAGVG
jgi:hypothetical protein